MIVTVSRFHHIPYQAVNRRVIRADLPPGGLNKHITSERHSALQGSLQCMPWQAPSCRTDSWMEENNFNLRLKKSLFSVEQLTEAAQRPG